MTTATTAPQTAKITAAKGGDTTVPPIKGKIAAAIKASGKSIMAISREHGLNPSQMRRLALDQVAKVDLPRAEAIATALGVAIETLFDAPQVKAKAAPKATAPKTTAPKTPKATAPKATGKATAPRSRAAKA